MNTMMINSRPINNVDVEAGERSPNPRNSIKDYASWKESKSCGGVPNYTGSGPFRPIIDAAIFIQSSSNWLSSVSLGTPSTQHHTTFKLLCFIIIIKCKYIKRRLKRLIRLRIINSSSLWSIWRKRAGL